MKDHLSILPWFISWPLILLVECLGLVACGFVGAPEPPKQSPAIAFSTTEVYDGHHLFEVELKDGTHCVLWTSSITCNWKQ